MIDPAMRSKEIFKKLSRRHLLRNSAIAATGTVLLPSFLTGCTKDGAPGVDVGGVQQLTPAQLEAAAANLIRMREWVTDLYPLCIEYEDAVFHALKSTKETESWTNFIVDIFIDIATVLAAAAAIAGGAAPAVPAFAFLSSILHDWGIGKDNRPDNLDEVFATFQFGHVRMQLAMEQELSSLVDPANNYSNLTTAWKDPIEFNGNKYTIGDLASSNFPGLGDDYNSLQTAAILSFEKALWNLVVMKCCRMEEVSNWYIYIYLDPNDTHYPYHSIVEYARTIMYPVNKGNYLRGGELDDNGTYKTFVLQSWRLGIDGNTFPQDAVDILFMDDTPGHIINPDGLFTRDYVFKQFHIEKPEELDDYFELDIYPNGNLCNYGNCPVGFDFTGGVFPELTQ